LSLEVDPEHHACAEEVFVGEGVRSPVVEVRVPQRLGSHPQTLTL
jgi:hypothetical protein